MKAEAVCRESTNKPKEQIVDIDAADAGNELAAVEYIEDIYKFYTLSENIAQFLKLGMMRYACCTRLRLSTCSMDVEFH
ncbi:hypothetical protein L6164_025265 [Bauhinia variegata]|uniref:Uncharacterized protein n=1 Tax=Bauhinia variegata TaxID=167791 RepID=A0ACB9M1U8_BAUVA|nr:hypothetical protein L6164_025265 [Bauhinia variegata]